MSDAVPKLRSAVTNGKRAFLTRGGELSLVGRRWRDIYGQIVEDRGGESRLSEAQRQMARRCATLSIEAEIMEAARAEGGDLDIEVYCGITNSLGRALGRLGLGRSLKNVTPDVAQYIEQSDGREL